MNYCGVFGCGFNSDAQPTVEQLQRAWTRAIEMEEIPGARGETWQKLFLLREAKHTWVGKEENDLRFSLDSYLRGDK